MGHMIVPKTGDPGVDPKMSHDADENVSSNHCKSREKCHLSCIRSLSQRL